MKNKQTILVTGGAGFIGSHIVDRLLAQGHKIIVCDNFSTGFREFLSLAKKNINFSVIELDLLDKTAINQAMQNVDFVFHMAANADVRFGTEQTYKDLEQNTIVTFNVLEAMRINQVKKIAFASTGSIYGEPTIFPTPEDAPFPTQTSLYGASKLACEGLIAAYCEGFNFQSWIFRFVSVLGERYTHGHIFDFYKKLCNDSEKLHVLGNGKQRKSYMYVHDCIDAMFLAIEKANAKVNLFNLGFPEYIEVNNSVRWITEYLNINPIISHSGGDRGWIGDNPFIFLDVARIQKLGWQPKLTIQQGIMRTLQWLIENPWVYKVRDTQKELL